MIAQESHNRICQLFVDRGIISPDDRDRAISFRVENPKREFGDILIEDIGIDHHTYFSTLAQLYAIKEHKFVVDSISEREIEFIQRTLDRLPEEIRERSIEKKVIPFKLLDGRHEALLVITPNPMDLEVRTIVAAFGYRSPEINYVRLDIIDELISLIYDGQNADLLDEILGNNGETTVIAEEDESYIDENSIDEEINQSMLPRLAEAGLIEAVRRGASDIHIIPLDDGSTEFYFRIDGALQLWCTHEGTKPEALAPVIKDRARGVDRFKRESAQDGFIQREVDGYRIRYRVSVLPLVSDSVENKLESIVIRVLDNRKVINDLAKLGLQAASREAFEEAISRPQGMVILTGPTGSGKSTTLNAALHSVLDPSRCVLTVEDPVEYMIKGARQVKIGHTLSFEEAVRSILRHDPDIVMVGEMRDLITAQTAIKLANTGHLTFSTLHTNDAVSVVSRLYKMGIEPFLIASSINLVVAQRLIRLLCPQCKEEMALDDTDWTLLIKAGLDEERIKQSTFFRPKGCQDCNNMGYKGRAGIHEVLSFSREVRQKILDTGDRVDEIAIRELALSQGMMSLRESGLVRVVAGETSLEEVLATTVAE